MITHDAFLALSELDRAGGRMALDRLEQCCKPRLKHSFAACWKCLLDTRAAELIQGAEGSVASKLDPVDVSTVPVRRTVPPKPINLETSSSSYAKLRSYAGGDVDPSRTRRLVRTAGKHTNAAYRAVVEGKKARRTAVQTFAESLSPLDAADFWEDLQGLSAEQQADFSRQLSRSAPRGRRDGAPPSRS